MVERIWGHILQCLPRQADTLPLTDILPQRSERILCTPSFLSTLSPMNFSSVPSLLQSLMGPYKADLSEGVSRVLHWIWTRDDLNLVCTWFWTMDLNERNKHLQSHHTFVSSRNVATATRIPGWWTRPCLFWFHLSLWLNVLWQKLEKEWCSRL